MHKNVIIIGLGNEYISDDGVGIYTLREVKKKFSVTSQNIYKIDFLEQQTGGIGLIDIISNYDICIIIDAMLTHNEKPGTIYRYIQKEDKELIEIKSSHQINLSQVITLAKMLDLRIPTTIAVYGLEVADVTTFNTKCTEEVEKGINNLADLIYNDLMNININTITDEFVSVYFDDDLTRTE